jgi:hypothetical protein
VAQGEDLTECVLCIYCNGISLHYLLNVVNASFIIFDSLCSCCFGSDIQITRSYAKTAHLTFLISPNCAG